ncbi:odorant receptor 83a-like [Polistes fuscatus]|uniref:odorant receptor 83a-like n=1 Tax=Polistes fuscatus TaxID=30207 RepID=UPI001CA80A8F|nr:odorant receptor 83a-like [Polistes fuscatus]
MKVKEIEPLEPFVPFENYIQHLITYLKYLRILRQTNTFSMPKLFLLNITVAISLFVNFVVIVSEISMISFHSDIEQISSTINPLGLHITGFIKWTYCIIKSKEISRLLDDLNRCYLLSKKIEIGKRDREGAFSKIEMKTVYKDSRILLYSWTTFCVYGVCHWCFNALLLNFKGQGKTSNTNNSNVILLPFITRQPWSIETVTGYTCSFIIQLVGGLTSAVGVSSYDILYVCILMVIYGQLRCLSLSLIDMNSIVGARTIEEFEMKLRCCVDHHRAVFKISKSLEALGSLPMFIQCIENIIIICLLSFEVSMIQIKMDSENLMKLFRLIEYFFALSVQLYIFCFYSTRIYTLSLQISDAVFACEWERIIYDKKENMKERKELLTNKVKHLILFLLLRSQKPIIMTGGPFYVLSLETFKSIMTLAVSNGVILRQFSDN